MGCESPRLAPARSPVRGWERAFLEARAARRRARKDSSVRRLERNTSGLSSTGSATSADTASTSAAGSMVSEERSLVTSPAQQDLPVAHGGLAEALPVAGVRGLGTTTS
mmetsp:Transcript_126666/g.366635  ORF Transcript_126666/g.366635 Transcript_126666/m.366635 type:complete len:109 (+) Transcript_126666:46-372(+)